MWQYIVYSFLLLCVLKFTLIFLQLLISRFGRSLGLGVTWISDHGEHAMICGATGSMGTAYTKMFASMHFNLILISNNAEKLNELGNSVREKYKLNKVTIIEADFTKNESFDMIKKRIESIDSIVVLVNAAGIYQPLRSFENFSSDMIYEMLFVNAYAPLRMIEIVLPQMINKNRGTIINFSSIIGEYRFPNYALYSATKAFMQTFSQALSLECKKNNIIVQNVCPLFVRSKSAPEIKAQNCLELSAGEVGYEAMRVVGIESTTYGHWKHRLIAAGMNILSCFLGKNITSRIVNSWRFHFICDRKISLTNFKSVDDGRSPLNNENDTLTNDTALTMMMQEKSISKKIKKMGHLEPKIIKSNSSSASSSKKLKIEKSKNVFIKRDNLTKNTFESFRLNKNQSIPITIKSLTDQHSPVEETSTTSKTKSTSSLTLPTPTTETRKELSSKEKSGDQ